MYKGNGWRGGRRYKRVLAARFSTPLNPADSIAQLERRQREVQGKIDALEDQARQNGIAPGNIH